VRKYSVSLQTLTPAERAAGCELGAPALHDRTRLDRVTIRKALCGEAVLPSTVQLIRLAIAANNPNTASPPAAA
jgi:hypothetical protein